MKLVGVGHVSRPARPAGAGRLSGERPDRAGDHIRVGTRRRSGVFGDLRAKAASEIGSNTATVPSVAGLVV